jgi:hypothetical protein
VLVATGTGSEGSRGNARLAIAALFALIALGFFFTAYSDGSAHDDATLERYTAVCPSVIDHVLAHTGAVLPTLKDPSGNFFEGNINKAYGICAGLSNVDDSVSVWPETRVGLGALALAIIFGGWGLPARRRYERVAKEAAQLPASMTPSE